MASRCSCVSACMCLEFSLESEEICIDCYAVFNFKVTYGKQL